MLFRSLTGYAELCIQGSCSNAPPPPIMVDPTDDFMLGRDRYVYSSYASMVDISGIGHSYEVRASRPHITTRIIDGGESLPLPVPRWDNLTPSLTVTGFGVGPDAVRGKVASFTYPTFPRPTCDSIACAPYYFDPPHQGGGSSSDFNGSGYMGMVFGYYDMTDLSDGNDWRKDFTVCVSTGRALECGARRKYSNANYVAPRAVGDFIGDGQPSILAETLVMRPGGWPLRTTAMQLCRVLGEDAGQGGDQDANIQCAPWAGVNIPLGIPSSASNQVYILDVMGTGRPQLVYYHSGQIVDGVWREDGRWEVFAPVDLAMPGEALDRIVRVTNGLGSVSSAEYADGLTSGTSPATPPAYRRRRPPASRRRTPQPRAAPGLYRGRRENRRNPRATRHSRAGRAAPPRCRFRSSPPAAILRPAPRAPLSASGLNRRRTARAAH